MKNEYYLIITNEIDYEWDIDNKFKCAGFPERNRNAVKKMKIGDKIIYYVTKHSKFVAVSEVVGPYFFSKELIWDDPFDLWPHRIETKPIVFRDIKDGIFIKDIWNNLEFIKNKNKWGSQVQGSLRRISENDFNCILKEISD